MNFYGIDLHTDCFTVAGLMSSKQGSIIKQGGIIIRKYLLKEEKRNEFLRTLTKEDYVALETTTNAFWFYDRVRPLVKECYVLDTHKLKALGNKTDKIDAKKLVDVLTYHLFINGGEDMPKVFVPPHEARGLRSLFSTYNLNKKMLTQLKNRVHSLFKQQGMVIDRKWFSSKRGRKAVLTLSIELPDIWMKQVELLIGQIERMDEELTVLHDMIIFETAQHYRKEMEQLLTIKGFSPLTAAAFMADVVDISRFATAKKLANYLRTAPQIKESNKKTHIENVNRASRSLTCSLLTQSVNHFKECSSHLNAFYLRMRRGKSAGKSRLALIRKIVVAAYYMLKRGQQFKWVDHPNYQAKLKTMKVIIARVERKKEKNEEKRKSA